MSLNFGQQLFPPRGELLASYDYFDVASGTGVVNFYGGNTSGGYILAKGTFYSCPVITRAMITTANYVKEIDVNFDVEFNLPRTISGKTIVNVPIGVYSGAVGPTTLDAYSIVKVIHYDGSTPTTLATSANGTVLTYTGGVGGKYGTNALEVDITEKHFKRGEILRLTVEVWARDSASTQNVLLGHDPKDRGTSNFDTYDFGTANTILSFQVPFKIST